MLGGILGGDAHGPAKAVFLAPPKRGKRHLVMGNGAAFMDWELPQRGEFGVAEKIPDDPTGGMIEDNPHGTIVGCVIGEQNHGFVEGAVP